MPISSMYHSVLMHEPVNCVYFYESTLLWKPQSMCCSGVPYHMYLVGISARIH